MQNMKLLDLQTGEYFELGKDWLYGGNYITLIEFDELVNKCKYNISEPPPLKTLYERVGAVVYGGRYVLNPQKANVIKVDQQGSRIRYTYGLGGSSFPFEVIGNLFEEYSKQLRNEPNKFEELMELLK